ncbi:DUF2306 domain-containing protein [Porphyrobacter sp. AAP82]|uniref:DUF2306 domain-containing protein n=1 Tax=Porphyrobacter sp. AAP82 TaxID=1248917 RepID=UPI0002D2BAA8|nr:DUF2306 domain-containing protein [Porphyrobacter sp. AAP82]
MSQHTATPERQISLGATAVLTILVTAALTILSMMFGGFGSGSPATPQARALSLPIMIHLSTVVPALLLGPVVLLRRKGDSAHKLMGRLWVCLMLVTAITSAFIRLPGGGIAGTGFSFIHAFTVWTLVSVPLAVRAARQGRIAAHRGMMTGLYAGLVIAGAFTFLPGRLLGSMVFGAP